MTQEEAKQSVNGMKERKNIEREVKTFKSIIALYNYTTYSKNLLGIFLIVLVSSFAITGCSSSQKEELGTFEDPKVAMVEAQKALSMLSLNLNKGYKSVQDIKEYERTKNKIFNLD